MYVCASESSPLQLVYALISWHIPLLRFCFNALCAVLSPIFLYLSPISSHMCFQATQGSQSAFHKDNSAQLNRWGINVLSVITIGLDTPRDRKDYSYYLEFSTKNLQYSWGLGACTMHLRHSSCDYFLHEFKPPSLIGENTSVECLSEANNLTGRAVIWLSVQLDATLTSLFAVMWCFFFNHTQ